MKHRTVILGFLIVLLSMGLTSCKEKNEKSELSEAKDQTEKNLESSLAGEGEANRKYTAYAKIADDEGLPSVARLWRAAAAAEAVHAKNYLKILGMLNDTEANLRSAVSGEQYEFSTMYPEYIKAAKEAGNAAAATNMNYAFQVEQLHFKMFEDYLSLLEEGKTPELVAYWVCGVCGNTVQKDPPKVCPICGSPQKEFSEIK